MQSLAVACGELSQHLAANTSTFGANLCLLINLLPASSSCSLTHISFAGRCCTNHNCNSFHNRGHCLLCRRGLCFVWSNWSGFCHHGNRSCSSRFSSDLCHGRRCSGTRKTQLLVHSSRGIIGLYVVWHRGQRGRRGVSPLSRVAILYRTRPLGSLGILRPGHALWHCKALSWPGQAIWHHSVASTPSQAIGCCKFLSQQPCLAASFPSIDILNISAWIIFLASHSASPGPFVASTLCRNTWLPPENVSDLGWYWYHQHASMA